VPGTTRLEGVQGRYYRWLHALRLMHRHPNVYHGFACVRGYGYDFGF
jgi:hypothetical protein